MTAMAGAVKCPVSWSALFKSTSCDQNGDDAAGDHTDDRAGEVEQPYPGAAGLGCVVGLDAADPGPVGVPLGDVDVAADVLAALRPQAVDRAPRLAEGASIGQPGPFGYRFVRPDCSRRGADAGDVAGFLGAGLLR